MPPQFCPISFTLFLSIKRGGKKTYSILMHIRGNSDTSSGGIDHRQSPIPRCMPMTSIIRPQGCWPMYSRQAPLSSTPFRAAMTYPLHHPATLRSPLFSTLPLSFGTSPIYPILCPFLSRRCFSFHPPLVSQHFCSLFIPSCNQITVTPCWC